MAGFLVPDLHALGREKFELSSLDTFNKKVRELISGKVTADEDDELLPPHFEGAWDNDQDNGSNDNELQD
jgi:hypothetical protein